METIKKWIEIIVPVTTCTLRCSYCYVTTHRLFDGPIPKYDFSPDFLRKALSKERLGGTSLLNFGGGGETLLSPEVVDFVRALLEEGHYVSVVTNGTLSKRFDEFASFPAELTSRLFFKFSYHYAQLKEKGLLDTFFNNIRKVRDAGCSFTLEQVPYDEVISIRDEVIDRAVQELGAAPHITVARDERVGMAMPILTELSREEYVKVWGDKYKSALFDYKMSIFEQPRKEFCYAGAWGGVLYLKTGEMQQCYYGGISWNIYKDVSKPIPWLAIGHNCRECHCHNGHSWITLGCVPELSAPTYADLRQRVCLDGTKWVQPEMYSFMSTKLYDGNKEYGFIKKTYTDIVNRYILFKKKVIRLIHKNIHK